MVRQDILGALRQAVLKGESLKKAMVSLYNAGYKKKDIEDAAKQFQYERQTQPVYPIVQPKLVPPQQVKVQPKPVIKPQPVQPIQRPQPKPMMVQKPKPLKKIQKPIPKPKPVVQRVSGYEPKPTKTKDIVILVALIFVLLILLGSLATVIIFREKLFGGV